MGNQTVTPPSPPHSACLPSCGQPTAGTFFHANGCPNNLMRTNPPSPPQSAEEAYREAQARRRDWSCLMFRVYGRPLDKHVQAVRDAECAMEAALDACIRAVLRERGHVRRCNCYDDVTNRLTNPCDSRCAWPAWLPEEIK